LRRITGTRGRIPLSLWRVSRWTMTRRATRLWRRPVVSSHCVIRVRICTRLKQSSDSTLCLSPPT
jgi:hypothetical protein